MHFLTLINCLGASPRGINTEKTFKFDSSIGELNPQVGVICLVTVSILMISCQDNPQDLMVNDSKVTEQLSLTLDQANYLSSFGFHCIDTEYPYKLGQVLGNNEDLKSPSNLHPAFYGCFDWHSAVHGHWALIRLLKSFPTIDKADSIRQKLDDNLSKENILQEVNYFDSKHNKSFERTYGWAWLLKLSEEFYTWDDPQARIWYSNLEPLTELIISKYLDFLPKLTYPIRVGEHSNTAFGLSFAYDYAITLNNLPLKDLIESRARDYYLNDQNCPIAWEPSGFDFLSPCLQEAFLMQKIMPKKKFQHWYSAFMGDQLESLLPADVSDRSDGKLVHLDGLNFSRAWCLYGLSRSSEKASSTLSALANKHLHHSFDKMSTGDYAGEHWLASFALYALDQKAEN